MTHINLDSDDPALKPYIELYEREKRECDEWKRGAQMVVDMFDPMKARASYPAFAAIVADAARKAHESVRAERNELRAALNRARAAAQVYVERVDALGLAADDNDPKVIATAEPLGEAQANLYAALGLLQRDESGKVDVVPPAETIEQLRAERDSARMLAEFRGAERDDLRAQVARLTEERDEARQDLETRFAEYHAASLRTCQSLAAQLAAALAERDAAIAEVARLKIANASLVPDAMLAAVDIECTRAELEAARKERDKARARASAAEIEAQTAERIATLAVQRALERTACTNPYHDDINDRNDAAADALRDFADDVRAFAWKETT